MRIDFSMDQRKHNEVERAYWARTKAQGKRRLIFRKIRFNAVLLFVIIAVFGATHRSGSLLALALAAIIMLPILLLAAYLSGKWEWADFEKKYPE